MHAVPFDVKSNFAEYVFARAVERHNLRVRDGQAGPAGRMVTVRQGRALRADVERRLRQALEEKKKYNPDKPVMGQATMEQLRDAMRDSFSGPMDGDPVWSVPAAQSERREAARRREAEMETLLCDYVTVSSGTRFDAGKDSDLPGLDPRKGMVRTRNPEDEGNESVDGMPVMPNGLMVPLSPYDPQFENLATFRENGGRILYASADPAREQQSRPDWPDELPAGEPFLKVRSAYGDVGQLRPASGPDRDAGSGVQLFALDAYEAMSLWERDGNAVSPSVRAGLRPVGHMVSGTDLAGLTLLKEYMTDKEYAAAEAWVSAQTDADGNSLRVPDRMARMAMAVCDELRNRGYEFTIEPDRRPGQLKAKIKGTKKEVRLTDLSERGEFYVGRVYEGGNYFYWKDNDKVRSADERMALTNLLYGLGVPASRIGWELYDKRDGLYNRIVNVAEDPKDDAFTYIGTIGHSFNGTGQLQGRRSSWNVDGQGRARLEAWAGIASKDGGRGQDAVIFSGNDHQGEYRVFDGPDADAEAANFLQEAVRSAKENFVDQVQLDELIALSRNAKPGDTVPALSDNPAVISVHKLYWQALTDPGSITLYRPGPGDRTLDVLTREAEEQSDEYDGTDDEDGPEPEDGGPGLGTYPASLSPEELVRAHMRDAVDYKFGGTPFGDDVPTDLPARLDSPDLTEEDRARLEAAGGDWRGFCPSLVAMYMSSGYGPVRNKEDLASAMRALDFTGEEFARFDDFDSLSIKDRLVKYDDASAYSLTGPSVRMVPRDEIEASGQVSEDGETLVSPFMADVRDTVVEALRMTGCLIDENDPESIRVDKNGIIHYKAYMMFGITPSDNERELHAQAWAAHRSQADYSNVSTEWIRNAHTIPVEGELGQVFEPDGDGLLETRYYGSRNKLMSPGYEAHIVMPRDGAATTDNLASRYRLRGLLETLTANISSQVRIDLQNGRGFPEGLGRFHGDTEAEREAERRRFLEADTVEARRQIELDYGMPEGHFTVNKDRSRDYGTPEGRERFVRDFEGGYHSWSYQMDNYLAQPGAGVRTGSTTSLNYTYRRGLYYTPYKLIVEPEPGESMKDTYVRQMTGMMRFPEQALRKVFRTNASAVHFPSYVVDGSSVMEEYRHEEGARTGTDGRAPSVHDVTNDNLITPYMLTGGANMAIQMENSHVVFPADVPSPEGMVLRGGTVLTMDIEAADRTVPAGTVLTRPLEFPMGAVLQPGTVLPRPLWIPGWEVPGGRALAADVAVPDGFTVPAGSVLGPGFANGVDTGSGVVAVEDWEQAPDGVPVHVGADGKPVPVGLPLEEPVALPGPSVVPAGTVLSGPVAVPRTTVPAGAPLGAGVVLPPRSMVPTGEAVLLQPGTEMGGPTYGASHVLKAGTPLKADVELRTGTVIPKGFRARVFDAVYTGAGKNQGGTRYLVEGVRIDKAGSRVSGPFDPRLADGTVSGPNDPLVTGGGLVGSMDDSARVAIVQDNPDLEYIANVPADRGQMVISNYMTGFNVAGTLFEQPDGGTGKDDSRGVRVAQMTLGGFTFDDGALVSADFARRYPVIGRDGKLRPLAVGDKICDVSGNKSVIAAVVDPDMDPGKAARKGLSQALETFRLNPDLDVVQSAYGAITRFSAASAKTGMANEDGYGPKDLVLPMDAKVGDPDGNGHKVLKGGVLTVPMIVTKQTADEHVAGYDDDAVEQGRGRKVSAQMSWILSSAGAEQMMDAIYGPDASSFIDTREYLIAVGYDLSPTGVVKPCYEPHPGERRFMFPEPGEDLIKSDLTRGGLRDECRKRFGEVMDQKGGFMDVPFRLEFAGGDPATLDPEHPSEKPAARLKLQEIDGKRGHYRMPVLSAHLRCGQEFQEGVRRTHDYTNHYISIYASGVEYLREKDKAGISRESTEENERMREIRRAAQRSMDAISNDVVSRRIDTKYGFARSSLMTRRMPRSATSIWTPDPTLDVGEIGVSADLLGVLGLKLRVEDGPDGKPVPVRDERGRMMLEGDLSEQQLLTTRDPVLDRGGVRSLRVVPVPGTKGHSIGGEVVEGTVGGLDDAVAGVQVNPLIAATYKGDFDGDSVGLVRLSGEEVLDEQYRKFSIDQNMLDMTTKRPNGDYALIINVGMDLVSAEHYDPSLAARRENIEHAANLVARGIPVERTEKTLDDGTAIPFWQEDPTGGELVEGGILGANRALAADLSDCMRDALCGTVATEAISFASVEEHLESLRQPIDHKAKGKPANLEVYGKYYGIDPEAKGEDGGPVVHKAPLATDEDMRKVECATAYKSYGTGNAGSIQQIVVAFARNAVLAEGDRTDAGGRPMPETDAVAARLSVLDAALYITQGATQGLLQAKHDPVKAKKFYAMINGPIPELFKGHKLAYEDGEWKTVYAVDKDTGEPKLTPQGFPIAEHVTPDEWMKTAIGVFKDSEKGLGLEELNDEHFAILAQAATHTVVRRGKAYAEVINMSRPDHLRELGASPMDICAYTAPRNKSTMTYLANMALNGMNMFSGGRDVPDNHSGGASAMFMPRAVKENERIMDEARQMQAEGRSAADVEAKMAEMRALMPGDVKDAGVEGSRKKAVVRVSAEVDAPEARQAKPRRDVAAKQDLAAEAMEEMAGMGGRAGEKYDRWAARIGLIEKYGMRTELLAGSSLRDDAVLRSSEYRTGLQEIRALDGYIRESGGFPSDLDVNMREYYTVRTAELAVMQHMLDSGRDLDVPMATTRAGEPAELTPEQTQEAAGVLRGMRAVLDSRELDGGEAALKLADGLRRLHGLGYQPFMTVEVDAMSAEPTGTRYVPVDEPRKTGSAGIGEPEEASGPEAPDDGEMLERLAAAKPVVREHYGVYAETMDAWAAESGKDPDERDRGAMARMQDMTVDMAEKLACLYRVDDRAGLPPVARLGYTGGDAPDYDEYDEEQINNRCEALRSVVDEMYGLMLGDGKDDASMAERRLELARLLANELEWLDEIGFERSGEDPAKAAAPAHAEPAAGHAGPEGPEEPVAGTGTPEEQAGPEGPEEPAAGGRAEPAPVPDVDPDWRRKDAERLAGRIGTGGADDGTGVETPAD